MSGPLSGPPRKRASERRGHRRYAEVVLTPAAAPVVVPVLADADQLLAVTRREWAALWSSPLVSVLAVETDLPPLTRLFHMKDEFERCRREFSKNRIVAGTKGRLVVNPLGAFMTALAGHISALEDRFGLTPTARLRLSIELGEAERSLEAMNARLARADEPAKDPRSKG